MTDFSIGAPFHVHDRDVFEITPEQAAGDPVKLAISLLVTYLFAGEIHERLSVAVGQGEFAWINEFEIEPSLRGPTLCVWIAPDAALFVGWTIAWHAPRVLMAADLSPPEQFRMRFRDLIPTYSRAFQAECRRRHNVRRARLALEEG